MNGARIQARGVDRAVHRLEGLGKRAADQSGTMAEEARWAQRQTTGVPVDTGRLVRSVKGGPESTVRVTHDGYSIGSRVPYAPFVFGGTKYMAAQPPQPPANAADHGASAINADLDQP